MCESDSLLAGDMAPKRPHPSRASPDPPSPTSLEKGRFVGFCPFSTPSWRRCPNGADEVPLATCDCPDHKGEGFLSKLAQSKCVNSNGRCYMISWQLRCHKMHRRWHHLPKVTIERRASFQTLRRRLSNSQSSVFATRRPKTSALNSGALKPRPPGRRSFISLAQLPPR